MKYKYEYIKTIDYWSIIISDIYDGGTVMFIYHGGTSKWTIDYWWYPYFILLRWWVVRTEHIISIWSLPHSAVHSWLRSRHMKKQRSTLYRKWASYGFDMTNIKIHNSYSEKIKSSYIVITHCYHHIYHNMDCFHSEDLNGTLLIYIAIEHTHCYHHTSQSQFGSFSLQGSLWHFVYVSIWHFFIIIKFDY